LRAGRLVAGGVAVAAALSGAVPATADSTAPSVAVDYRAAIVNGEVVSDPGGEFRTLRLSIDHGDGDLQVCSAVAVSRRHAVTAAHCFGADTEAFDSHSQAVVVDEPVGMIGGVVQFISRPAIRVDLHPQWSGAVGDADTVDLAVVEIGADFDGPPSALSQSGFGPAHLVAGTDGPAVETAVTGWGVSRVGGPSSEQLRIASMTTRAVTPSTCGGLADRIGLLCSAPQSGSACFGDSGGPVWIRDTNGRLRVQGVVSAGSPTCSGLSFEVNVSAHLEWVDDMVGGIPPTEPSPPSGLLLSGADSAIDVTFGAPVSDGGSLVTEVVVSVDGDDVEIDAPTGGGTVRVLGLPNRVEHLVAVRAINEVGASAAISGAVAPVGPVIPAAPANVVLDQVGADLVVEWTLDDDGDAPIELYEIEVTSAPSEEVIALRAVVATFTSAITRLELFEAEQGRAYSVRIRARNAKGWGPWSARIGPLVIAHPSGYWLLDVDGGLHPFGTAGPWDLDNSGRHVWVDAASASSGRGLWALRSDGRVVVAGDADWHGDLHQPAGADQAAVSPTKDRPTALAVLWDGSGYWIFTAHGRVYAFGSAEHLGELDLALNAEIIDASTTRDADGYYMVGADGGVFAFGAAPFHGSTGGLALNSEVVAIVPDPDGDGYWLIGGDGGVFAFAAPFLGSVPGVIEPGAVINEPVVGGVLHGDGYLLVAGDGGVFNFSDEPFLGSLGAAPPDAPVVAVATWPRLPG